MNAQTPNERSGDNPSVLNKLPTRTQCIACDMTLPYLRGVLATWSVVWVFVQYLFLTFMKLLVQLCKNFFQKL